MTMTTEIPGFHYAPDAEQLVDRVNSVDASAPFVYTFANFFHPFVGDLLERLNDSGVAGVLDPIFLGGLAWQFDYPIAPGTKVTPPDSRIDLSISGPYANYNWELMYHIPVMIAVHLSNHQRFAEAQKWFHYVFDPTCADTTVAPPSRFWKFLAFRDVVDTGGPGLPSYSDIQNINTLLRLLSTSDDQLSEQQRKEKRAVFAGYQAMLANPFQPHVVARVRPGAYQWYVVMKYLDNLIAWGDSLFLQNTIETINEATLCYVLAANILGPRPQSLPQRGVGRPKTFLELKQGGLDPMGNALIDLEGQFPFNLSPGPGQTNGGPDQSGALFGIGRALYFCIPANQKLLAYWDTVADRLFKIRNSESILGVVQQLPLFDPPLDPGMLVKAVAAGIDLSSIVSGLNQPLGNVRSPLLIQKALEIAGEVRALGSALLASIEKGEAETLALKREDHEVKLQQMVQNVRYLQWQHAQATTEGLLKTRLSALERYTYYLRLMGQTPDANADQPTVTHDLPLLTEDNFADVYNELVGQYDKKVTLQNYSNLEIAGRSSPSNQSGASGSGQLYLSGNEDAELNTHTPSARENRQRATASDAVASGLALIPNPNVNLHFWGLGGSAGLPGGTMISAAGRIASDIFNLNATDDEAQAARASKTASYQRRADEWMFQTNLAARELMQIGRQLIASLIAEQIARNDYETVKRQVGQAQEIRDYLAHTKFTNTAFYDWQSSELAGLYYQYYRFACDTARKAEQTMKRELMRPELDSTQFIQFNYWDTGHKGLLSGEALYLDIKRMEMAYHDSNRRELELIRHVSLRQLDPLALFQLKTTASCTVTVPEWLYDLDCPGHYMRRLKNVAVSVPCVVGPYTSLNCTVSLQRSTLRVSPLLKNDKYGRDPSADDDRFVDYFGAADVIVTSSAANDTGMFETNLKDERFLPFEGAGAISTWSLSLPPLSLRSFDYMTISDVILHIRYTARPAGDPLAATATSELGQMLNAGTLSQTLMFCLRFDFPSEWSTFVSGPAGSSFVAILRKDYFPYLALHAKQLLIDSLTLYAPSGDQQTVDLSALSGDINGAAGTATLTLPESPVLTRDDASRQVYLLVRYHLSMQA